MADMFGVEIDELETRVLDITPGNPSTVVIASAKHDPLYYQGGVASLITKEAELIDTLVKKAGIKKRDLAITMATAYSYAQIVDMPLLNEKELASAIQFKAEEIIPLPLGQANLDTEILAVDQKSRRQIVLVVAAAKDIIDKVQKTVESTPYTPAIMETEPVSIIRYIHKYPVITEPGHIVMYVTMGASSSTLYAYNTTKRSVVQLYTFPIGKQLIIKDLSINKALPLDKAGQLFDQYGFTSNPEYEPSIMFSAILMDIEKNIKRFVVSVQEKEGLPVDLTLLMKEAVRIPGMEQLLSPICPNIHLLSLDGQYKTASADTPVTQVVAGIGLLL